MKRIFRKKKRQHVAGANVAIMVRELSAKVRKLTAIAKASPDLVKVGKGHTGMENALVELEPLLEAIAEAHRDIDEAVMLFRSLRGEVVA